MKQETTKIIKKKFKRLNKYLSGRDRRFNTGAIHSFRLEVKKLRSFLELLSVGRKKIVLPKRLKKLYRIMGRIRLIQLQRTAITETTEKYHIPLPVQYLISLESEKRELKNESKDHFPKMKALNPYKFSKNIPDKIRKENCLKYLSVQQNTLYDLIHTHPLDDQSLHEVRKIFKGTLYDLPYIKDGIKTNPELMKVSEEKLKFLESKIGKFHDISVAIQLIDEVPVYKYGMEENKNLISIREQWQKDRDDIRNNINQNPVFL